MTVSQMTLETALIDILDIKFTQKNDYSEDLINELAQLLIKQNGSTQPLVVKKTGIDSYELIEGEIVLLAALKAQQIDKSFELLRAYIQKDLDYTLEKQLIAKIEKTKTEKKECSEVKELETEVLPKEEPTDWLIVNEEYVKGGDWYSLNQKETEIRNTDPKAKTIIKTMRDEQWLLDKKAEYEAYLDDINKELIARAELL